LNRGIFCQRWRESGAESLLSAALRLVVALAFAALCSVGQAADGEQGGAYVSLDTFVVNLKDDSYISFALQLKLSDPQQGDYVKAYVPVMRYELIKQMMWRDAAEVQTQDFMRAFAQTTSEMAERIIGPGYVKGAFITQWTIQ
jgi:flagellar basal body-associated protein FliL